MGESLSYRKILPRVGNFFPEARKKKINRKLFFFVSSNSEKMQPRVINEAGDVQLVFKLASVLGFGTVH